MLAGTARRRYAGDVRAGCEIGGRFFRYQFLTAMRPSRRVKRSQPVTSTYRPSLCVPVNVHSETPRRPARKCLGLAQCASGNVSNTAAKAARTAGAPSCRCPSASGPADASNTQSSVIIDMSASRSCRFQASAKRSSNAIESASDVGVLAASSNGRVMPCIQHTWRVAVANVDQRRVAAVFSLRPRFVWFFSTVRRGVWGSREGPPTPYRPGTRFLSSSNQFSTMTIAGGASPVRAALSIRNRSPQTSYCVSNVGRWYRPRSAGDA